MLDIRGRQMEARLFAIREVAAERGRTHRDVFALIPSRRTAWRQRAKAMGMS